MEVPFQKEIPAGYYDISNEVRDTSINKHFTTEKMMVIEHNERKAEEERRRKEEEEERRVQAMMKEQEDKKAKEREERTAKLMANARFMDSDSEDEKPVRGRRAPGGRAAPRRARRGALQTPRQ